MKCKHNWIYANKIYTTLPPQRDRICSKCGKKECVTMGVKIPHEDTYDGISERFANLVKVEGEKNG